MDTIYYTIQYIPEFKLARVHTDIQTAQELYSILQTIFQVKEDLLLTTYRTYSNTYIIDQTLYNNYLSITWITIYLYKLYARILFNQTNYSLLIDIFLSHNNGYWHTRSANRFSIDCYIIRQKVKLLDSCINLWSSLLYTLQPIQRRYFNLDCSNVSLSTFFCWRTGYYLIYIWPQCPRIFTYNTWGRRYGRSLPPETQCATD